jgi:exodeoxyribonuclease VII large subunit
MREATTEHEIGFEQLTRLINERLRGLGELQIRAEITSARVSSDDGLQLEFGTSLGHHLRGYLPGRLRGRIDGTLRQFSLSCDDVLQKGHEVVLSGRLQYRPEFNHVELIVSAVRPHFVAGITAQERDALRKRLQAEGVQPQSAVHRPFAPRRIGVISGRNAAGLEDFERILRSSHFEYFIQPELIPLFGSRSAGECRRAIERLASTQDLIVLVRGGGAAGSFAMFDDEAVVRAVAHCMTPVMCGTGHDRDCSLTDEFAFCSAVSPSDAAHKILEYSEHDSGVLFALADKARGGVNDALGRRRKVRLKARTLLLAGGSLVVTALALIGDPAVSTVLLAVLLMAAWIAWRIRRRRARVQPLARPRIVNAADGCRWLRELPMELDSLTEAHLEMLQAMVDSVRNEALARMKSRVDCGTRMPPSAAPCRNPDAR